MPDVPWIVTNVISAAAAFGAMAAACVAGKSYRAATSPHVIAYVYVTMDYPQTAMLRVENIGQAPAYGVRVEVDACTLSRLSACAPALGTFTGAPWPFLPPGGTRETLLGKWDEFAAAMGNRKGDATVSYSAADGGKESSEAFPMESRSFMGTSTPYEDATNHLARIDDSLRDIAKALGKRRP